MLARAGVQLPCVLLLSAEFSLGQLRPAFLDGKMETKLFWMTRPSTVYRGMMYFLK